MAISRGSGSDRIVNSALLGAFARVLGDPPLATLEALLLSESPQLREENGRACAAGYQAAGAQLQGSGAMTPRCPPTAWTTGTTEVFKTGTWRAALPRHLARPSPCHQACP
jgi:hypothetical protein